MTTLRSPLNRGSRGDSLFVPRKTFPPATVTLPYDCEPSLATQRTFFVVAMSISSLWPRSRSELVRCPPAARLYCPAVNAVGSPVSADTMLREPFPPQIGQSAACAL